MRRPATLIKAVASIAYPSCKTPIHRSFLEYSRLTGGKTVQYYIVTCSPRSSPARSCRPLISDSTVSSWGKVRPARIDRSNLDASAPGTAFLNISSNRVALSLQLTKTRLIALQDSFRGCGGQVAVGRFEGFLDKREPLRNIAEDFGGARRISGGGVLAVASIMAMMAEIMQRTSAPDMSLIERETPLE
jgi:hypothetical protein